MDTARHPLDFETYKALMAASAVSVVPDWPARPNGECAWIHLGDVRDLPAILDLADRLHNLRGALTILLTRAPGQNEPWAAPLSADYIVALDAPAEHPDAVDAFLRHWMPDVALWVWGNLRPLLVDAAAAQGIPLHMVSAEKAGFQGWQANWTGKMAQRLAALFDSASARSAGGAQRLARFGFAADTIAVWPPLRPSGRVLPCAADDLDTLSAHLNTRPVWLAADVPNSEWPTILEAHSLALRSAHRLLLVLNPADGVDPDQIRADLHRNGLFHETWSDGETPDETTQVLIADLPNELGLWFRVAAASYIGGTMFQGPGGGDPMIAASLGTAVLHGPNVGHFGDGFSRLHSKGALDLVQDAASLGAAVARSITPDRAAEMALAGWDVVSEGAETVDAVIDLVQDSLDGPALRGRR